MINANEPAPGALNKVGCCAYKLLALSMIEGSFFSACSASVQREAFDSSERRSPVLRLNVVAKRSPKPSQNPVQHSRHSRQLDLRTAEEVP
jgi:hypothetical protein